MKAFVVRLNPDTREGSAYSRYPSLKEYKRIHESSPMNGFHEAVNFLSEDGVVRGYLPPKHLRSMRTGEPFVLVTITAKTAESGGDMIVGIQAGCRYEGDNTRLGGASEIQSLRLNWHYSCRGSMSFLLGRQVPNARQLVLGKNSTWVRGPTFEIGNVAVKRIMDSVQKLLPNKEKAKYTRIKDYIRTVPRKGVLNISMTHEFDLQVTAAMSSSLHRVIGKTFPNQIEVRSFQYQRDPRVVAYALKTANGRCADCERSAPFVSRQSGFPYLEVHHIKMLKDGGSDTRENVIALCPNCHRKRHYG